ncbi:AtpZ/AtpI family protein [Campylobacter sp. MIT 21-1685]|uniref:AtpZ/AtpI family protein n=1 Tax=unclassified Campylobacter TaxID=2593542 RepID=UPI00224A90CF|nr:MULTISPECIES: AtpZ/AtpI family protein [unclassified Campylobacter]MCX2682747.1 AtpZ/AtpI family protein [Campylobacter sp. MIT 21-1684]MCX2751107.1 AtpZ/AtpI family protein [Campylobacter sp. MIT 21-1682]MCX2807228.1 AtpZ/AtpI family protein [Campylobacter sp. MIT 21-1685]
MKVDKNNAPSSKKHNFIRKSLEAAESLSLGISIVVAVLLGIGIGLLLKKFTPYPSLFWLGVFWGVAGAILNIYKAYKAQVKSYEQYNQYEDDKKNNGT